MQGMQAVCEGLKMSSLTGIRRMYNGKVFSPGRKQPRHWRDIRLLSIKQAWREIHSGIIHEHMWGTLGDSDKTEVNFWRGWRICSLKVYVKVSKIEVVNILTLFISTSWKDEEESLFSEIHMCRPAAQPAV